MSSYIPPHMRNRNKERKASLKEKEEDTKTKTLVNTDENFPSLGGSGSVKKSSWGGSKSFASLATEWKEHEMEQKADEERRRVHEIRTRTVVIPRTHLNISEPVYEEDYEEPPSSRSATGEDEWTTISKKVRVIREKSMEELDREEEEERRAQEERESLWTANQPQEYETYWDERRY